MLTKALIAIVMTGALYVAGDAAVKNFDCCFPGSECCYPGSWCCPFEGCHGAKETKAQSSDCCSSGAECCNPPSDCCVGATGAKKATTPHCCSESK